MAPGTVDPAAAERSDTATGLASPYGELAASTTSAVVHTVAMSPVAADGGLLTRCRATVRESPAAAPLLRVPVITVPPAVTQHV